MRDLLIYGSMFAALLVGSAWLSCGAYHECREAGGGKMLCLRLVTR